MNRIEVPTIFGKIFAEVSGDSLYPGITICVELDSDDGKYEKQLALVECTPDTPIEGSHALRLMVWNSDGEDFTDDFTFFEDCPETDSREALWSKYLDYLQEWAESHNGYAFYGMTPACFEEWLNHRASDRG